MNYHQTVLTNGLRVITIPMLQAESMTAMVLVGAGSRFETEKTKGISHFLEHMTFKGTAKRPSAFAISSTVDAIGAEMNAATSKEETFFYIKAAKKHLPLAVDILADMMLAPKLDQEEIEREKGVIIEEINMYEDLPMRRVTEYFEQLLYPGSKLGWDVAGEKELIRKINKDDFLQYRRRLYFPENMILVVAGGVTEKEVNRLAGEYLGKIKAGGQKEVTGEKFVQKGPKLMVKSKKTDQTHLVLGFRGNRLGHPDRYVEAVLAAILGGGMSSRLFIQVRERRSLAYYVRTDADHYLDNGYLATSAGVDTQRIEDAIGVILEEHQKLAKAGSLEAEELKKAKEYVKGRMILDLEDSRNVAAAFGMQSLLENRIKTPDEILAAIDAVTKEDIIRVAKEFFVTDRLNLAVVGPFEDEKRFANFLKL